MITVNNVHSVIGSKKMKWVMGILTQREDANYYLEDQTLAVKLSFSELMMVDPDIFVTENCILLCKGYYENEVFKVVDIQAPPLHHRKKFLLKLNEKDYFGSYFKKQKLLAD
mmetsp:Transcript_42329/g.31003  ORF Transcript_42329/g.31003 Transcript_42329/m.31003 type:complete len:112 (-) Transcript_42329:883-1218(-)